MNIVQFGLRRNGHDGMTDDERKRKMEDPDDTLDRIVGHDTRECGGHWEIDPFQRMELKEALRKAYRSGMDTGASLGEVSVIPWAALAALMCGFIGFLVGAQ